MNHVVNKCQKMFKAFHMFRYFVQPTAEKRKRSAEEKITSNKTAADYTAEHRTHLVIAESNGLIPL